jgi:lipopolysaccharide transport system ATP-binding protein
MSEPGIVFDGVWKKFRRGEIHDSLRDLIPAVTRRLLRRERPDASELHGREFWALRDVSFEVKPGETLGIIGANGAGKSTVLKVLNRILRPTRGYCEVRGRAGALIEVSAGFHQDLTGRQNVFLQGSIMGMRAVEIQRKFDAIVEFAGMGEFIDTPVKRYSSGMNARLGFSIAAHLDPEVLIIDEVLAVGDMAFQERAFGRIREMATRGIPVVLVSHQLERVSTLCSRVLLLDRGQVMTDDTAENCIAAYVMKTASETNPLADSNCPVRLTQLRVLSPLPADAGSTLHMRVSGISDGDGADRYDPLHLRVRSAQTGKLIFGFRSREMDLPPLAAGPFELDVELELNLQPGIYSVETAVHNPTRGRDASKGPMAYFQVASERRFEGLVQLFPKVRPVPAVEVDPAGEHATGALVAGSNGSAVTAGHS